MQHQIHLRAFPILADFVAVSRLLLHKNKNKKNKLEPAKTAHVASEYTGRQKQVNSG